MKKLWMVAMVCAMCIDWTRIRGTVKNINQKTKTVAIQNRDGDVLTVPIDEDVKIVLGKADEVTFKDIKLDQRVTLIRIPTEPKPKDESFDEMNPRR